jgi:hypothetical protein
MKEGIIVTGTAHIRKVALAVMVHRRREAQLDQVRDRRQVPQDVHRADVGVIVRLHRDRDRAH